MIVNEKNPKDDTFIFPIPRNLRFRYIVYNSWSFRTFSYQRGNTNRPFRNISFEAFVLSTLQKIWYTNTTLFEPRATLQKMRKVPMMIEGGIIREKSPVSFSDPNSIFGF